MALARNDAYKNYAKHQIYTIGHSNKTIEEFIALLQRYEINVIVDVRSNPYSRYVSQFNQKPLQRALYEHDIKYIFMGNELGGQPKDNRFYDDKGYVLYYAIASEPSFEAGIERLKKGLQEEFNDSIMCSEENPHDCHRRLLVSRVLIEHGISISHIRANGNLQTEADDFIEAHSEQLSFYESGASSTWKSMQPVLQEKQQQNPSARLRKTGSN